MKSSSANSSVAGIPLGKRAGFRRYYRIFRWVMLASAVPAVAMIFLHSPLPEIELNPDSMRSAELKIDLHLASVQRGRASELELDQMELNSWLDGRLMPAPHPDDARAVEDIFAEKPEPIVEAAQTNVRDVKIELLEDHLRAYVVFDFHGVDLSLVLAGKLYAEKGYLRFRPTEGKLGLLPLPEASLRSAMHRLFETPQNKEKFRLPPGIVDVGVRNGKIYLTSYD